MKVRLVAAAAFLAAGGAQALTPAQIDAARAAGTLKEVYLAGASAQRLFIAGWFQQQCKNTGATNTFDVFFNGTGAVPNGSSYRAYSCELKKKVGNWLAGTKVLIVKRDAGGSFEGVNPIALAAAQTNMLVDGSCTATGNPSPATDILLPGYACNGTVNRVSDAGLSDVEPALFQKPVNLPDGQTALTTAQLNALDVKSVNQTIFGVAVNKKLYRALQEAQGFINPGDPIDEAVSARPSLSASFVASVLSGQASGSSASKNGWNIVIPATVDPNAVDKQINVCRRVIGSGTQASSNIFFLNLPSQGAVDAGYIPFGQTFNATKKASIGANVGVIQQNGTRAVVLGSGSGNVETCLGTTVETAAGTAYGLGVLSRENTPLPTGTTTDKGYRFVKLNGLQPQRDNVKLGNGYDFVFNATMQYNKNTLVDPDTLAFVKALRSNAGTAASLNVVDVDTQQGIMAGPSTYAGAYEDLVDPVTLKFASRVDRRVNNSVTPLRIVK